MKDILTVTQLNEQIKDLLEDTFEILWIEGEVSNLRRPASGHMYFTLKDDKSQIRAVIFRHPYAGGNRKSFDLEDGAHIVCRARLGVYQPRGEYQLIVDYAEPLGVGALQRAFEQLKARLAAEGLFDAARKQAIPFVPERIGLITSPTGAVIRDILNITGRRFPSVNILVAPVRVQGSEAPAEVIQAIQDMQSVGGVDVIIIARGGGSIEDLAPFNDEGVARAIAGCRVPVISAIGHETDFTIADFVADMRAPTPSAAAEMAVPVRAELRALVEGLSSRLHSSRFRIIRDLREWVADLEDRLRDPARIIADLRLTIDDYIGRLNSGLENRRIVVRQRFKNMKDRLSHNNPLVRAKQQRIVLELVTGKMSSAWQNNHARLLNRVSSSAALLDSLSPLAVLKRGYSIIRSLPGGAIIKDAALVKEDSLIDVRLASGSLQAKVTKVLS